MKIFNSHVSFVMPSVLGSGLSAWLGLATLLGIKGINIITSEHPKNRNEKEPTLTALVNCDYVIADAGSTIYEAWALGKPVIFPDWIVKKNLIKNIKGSAEEYIYSNNIGYHANNIDEFINFLKGDLIIEKNVTEFMEEYMPSKFNGTSGKAVLYEINKSITVGSIRKHWDGKPLINI